jgi:hypothetical protein
MASTHDRTKRAKNYFGPKEGGVRAEIASRKDVFDSLNRFIIANGGFVVSIPGADTIVFEVLPNSPIPLALTELGYDVRPADPAEGQRILAAPIVERVTLTSSGAFEPLTPDSTKAVAEIRTHAGIARVMRYAFNL